jgi:hypothetical protein
MANLTERARKLDRKTLDRAMERLGTALLNGTFRDTLEAILTESPEPEQRTLDLNGKEDPFGSVYPLGYAPPKKRSYPPAIVIPPPEKQDRVFDDSEREIDITDIRLLGKEYELTVLKNAITNALVLNVIGGHDPNTNEFGSFDPNHAINAGFKAYGKDRFPEGEIPFTRQDVVEGFNLAMGYISALIEDRVRRKIPLIITNSHAKKPTQAVYVKG